MTTPPTARSSPTSSPAGQCTTPMRPAERGAAGTAADRERRRLSTCHPRSAHARNGRFRAGACDQNGNALGRACHWSCCRRSASATIIRDRQAPIDYYLSKPVRQSDLYDAIATAMSQQSLAAGFRCSAAAQSAQSLVTELADAPVSWRARAGRRRQPGQSAGGRLAMLESLGLRCQPGRQRPPRSNAAARSFRPRADGLPDARNGRLRGHRRDPRPAGRRPPARPACRSSR
jgi:hypothetical protein